MIIEELYSRVLIKPVNMGGDELFIVSGFASATFARRHLLEIIKTAPNVKINLLIGMRKKSPDHSAFLNLLNTYPDNFVGYYYLGRPEVHSKVYAWFKENVSLTAFSGSANYSQYGFLESKQGNQMTPDNGDDILSYFTKLKDKSTLMHEFISDDVEPSQIMTFDGSLPPGEIEWIIPGKTVKISFLDRRTGNVPPRSGLNWGQRPEYRRDPNQAYLSIKQDARDEGFLPEKGFTFSMLTDDNKSLDCTVQQQGRKGVTTTNDNSELGLYIRNRLGINSGDPITTKNLEEYGRTDFTLEKIDDETFNFYFNT